MRNQTSAHKFWASVAVDTTCMPYSRRGKDPGRPDIIEVACFDCTYHDCMFGKMSDCPIVKEARKRRAA